MKYRPDRVFGPSATRLGIPLNESSRLDNPEKLAALQAAITPGLEGGVSDKTLDNVWAQVEARHGLAVEVLVR